MGNRMSMIAIVLLSAIAVLFPFIRRRRMKRTWLFGRIRWGNMIQDWITRSGARRIWRLIS